MRGVPGAPRPLVLALVGRALHQVSARATLMHQVPRFNQGLLKRSQVDLLRRGQFCHGLLRDPVYQLVWSYVLQKITLSTLKRVTKKVLKSELN